MPHFIKTGFWALEKNGYKGWLNLEDTLGGGSSAVVEVTYTSLQTLISSSSLSPGTVYKITGFNKNMPNGGPSNPNGYLPEVLYDDGTDSGVTIYMQALTKNTLSSDGYGEFYNPVYGDETTYSNTDGTGLYGIWDGDNPDPLEVPAYVIDQVVFWGGYAWRNVTGNVGSIDNILTLSADWEKLPYYNSPHYTIVIDNVSVDWNNGIVITRTNLENQITVEFNADQYSWWMGLYNSIQCNPISAMAWGLYSKITPEQLDYDFYGISNVSVINSYCETVNFKGVTFLNIKMENSFLYQNYIGMNSNIYSNTLTNGYINSNTLTNSYINYNTLTKNSNINNNTLTDNSINYNTLTYSYINYNTFTNSNINYNTLTDNSSIDSNTLTIGSINNNTLTNNSYINNNTFTYSNIYNNTLINNSYISSNTLTNNSYINSNTLTNSGIDANTLTDNSNIINNTLTNGSYISSNTLTSGGIDGNTLTSGGIDGNTLTDNSNISSNTLTYSYFSSNRLTNSSNINNNTLINNSNIYNNTLINNSNISSNTLKYSTFEFVNITGNVQFNNVENCYLNDDIDTATNIYATNYKQIFKIKDDTIRLGFYNNSAVFTVAAVNS